MSLVYRFRITFEDYDDVQRDIEIKSTQTFEDLHHIIQQSIGFDDKKSASFFMSNDNWQKGKELSLEKRKDKNGTPITLMKHSRLSDFITDPHQKFLYVSDYDAQWSLMMELVKLIPAADPMKMYPSCVKTTGEAPKQYNVPVYKPSALEEEEMEEESHHVAEPSMTGEEGVEDEELIGMNEEGEDEAQEEEEMEMEENADDEDEA